MSADQLYRDTLIRAAAEAMQAGHATEAEATFRLAVGGGLHDGEALYCIGHLSLRRGDVGTAAFLLTEALRLEPNHASAHNDLGAALRLLGRDDLALPHLERAIALEPEVVEAYTSLSGALLSLNRLQDALHYAQEALEKSTDKASAHCNIGLIHQRLDQTAAALEQYHMALADTPDFPRARYLDAILRLSLGEMPATWLGLEERLRLPPARPSRHFAQNRWRGEPGLDGRRILLHAEAGLGNTIQFVRYAPLVAALGAAVLLEVQPGLKSLLSRMPGVTAVVAEDEPLPEFDLHCPLMSLPLALRTTMEMIPATIPYLSVDPFRRGKWEERLGPWWKMRVGLAWSGAGSHPMDADRSLSLGRLDGLIGRPDIECHVIQSEIREPDRIAMADLPALADHSGELTSFEDTAALVSLMDLVVSVDTAPAHLAGALGKPTWLMLTHEADWRWLRERGDSPWYPSFRLFRQPRRGDWQPVLDMLNRQLDLWSKLQ